VTFTATPTTVTVYEPVMTGTSTGSSVETFTMQ
jgi:hypothetical protein